MCFFALENNDIFRCSPMKMNETDVFSNMIINMSGLFWYVFARRTDGNSTRIPLVLFETHEFDPVRTRIGKFCWHTLQPKRIHVSNSGAALQRCAVTSSKVKVSIVPNSNTGKLLKLGL